MGLDYTRGVFHVYRGSCTVPNVMTLQSLLNRRWSPMRLIPVSNGPASVRLVGDWRDDGCRSVFVAIIKRRCDTITHGCRSWHLLIKPMLAEVNGRQDIAKRRCLKLSLVKLSKSLNGVSSGMRADLIPSVIVRSRQNNLSSGNQALQQVDDRHHLLVNGMQRCSCRIIALLKCWSHGTQTCK